MSHKYVLGVSGGKDSAALAIYMKQEHPELDIEYFFTDTGKELPEVYEYLDKLEGFLGKPIHRLNEERGFDFWLEQYGNYLPSPKTRWCTRQLKLLPFKNWVNSMLRDGHIIHSFVAIRADEEHRDGYNSHHENLHIHFPFREAGYVKNDIFRLLNESQVGIPKYYEWRSRSGCTFCFFQQKIEWVRLKERHPEAFEEAKTYEKKAIECNSPFLWSQGESLEDLEKPQRIEQIKSDFEARKLREQKNRPINALHQGLEDIDELYYVDEGNGSCNICHK
ncbi:TPA: phosphoadenosine phosphosulfate reductase family protein [Vibrio vulnificus]|nr:phosphoadenosine phosphosulfate reductase family protein [Vibrio parahaemolyticus]HDY8019377.1 phosphoadenosine phosphosulfate reductase family protein [Vibrio vulnificus]